MARTGEILVGVDGSSGSEAALRWAMHEAAVRSGTVVALLAWTADNLPHNVFHDPAQADYDVLATAAAEFLDRAIARSGEPGAAVAVRRLVVRADPVEALIKQAATADMIVVGARGHGPMHRMLAGSVSQGAVHHAPVPVVVARGTVASVDEQARDGRPVVVGIDGSSPSLAALRWAVVEANARNVALRVVHAWGSSDLLHAQIMVESQAALVRQAQQILDQTVASHASKAANIDAVVAADPATLALLREAADAQLLVVGSRGRGGFAELVLGSVSHQCVLHAACPVAVVREGQH